MTFELRVLTVGLAAFAMASGLAALIVPWLASRQDGLPAARRAGRLGALRLLPVIVSTIAGVAVTMAFVAFEPRGAWEYVGWTIRTAAAGALATLVLAAWRSVRLVRATRRVTRSWFDAAEPIALPGIAAPALAVTSAYPIVAVVGLRQPTLVIARSVLAACTADELDAILAHEQGHVDRRDNLRRLLMSVTPDVLGWLPFSDRLYAAWVNATEEAADDNAARASADGRWHLASALIKVARLAAASQTPTPIPASALYCGGNLDTRVRRLLEPPQAGGPSRLDLARLSAAVAALAIVAALAWPGLHALVEVAIRALP
jgi:Zn-dependent protease with chaperone function